ncbi:integrating conjugative element protein, PFL_4693 family [Pseudomonas sp. NFACC45]|nr:TIGR03759 family integrating conjugative element protein [Pseudomonas sp. NFACC45]SFH38542.1 integrating conjugative element protein, PFL_4693 family [Pseudomonas sp. NFACC45]
MFRLHLLPLLALSLCCGVQAQHLTPSTLAGLKSKPQNDTTASLESALLAQQWGLEQEEYDRFTALMRGPLGTYSPHLDPLSALGIEARTDAERQRYAQLQVEAEAVRVEKLLSYQRAYDQAWKNRFPGMVLINPPPLHSPLLTKTAGRKSVFVRLDCTECEHRVRQLQVSGTAFDLYIVDSQHDDNGIRQWAQKVGIRPIKVRDGTISINHDKGRWISIGDAGELPAVMQEVNGRWLRQ